MAVSLGILNLLELDDAFLTGLLMAAKRKILIYAAELGTAR